MLFEKRKDLARGLLILFKPFRIEMDEIHCKDVNELLSENRDVIEERRSKFEKYRVMADLISNIQSETEKEEETIDEEETFEEIETTALADIELFERWARTQATKD